MEAKNNIIRRALEQAPGTQLPEGFCERLMERLERESARRIMLFFASMQLRIYQYSACWR